MNKSIGLLLVGYSLLLAALSYLAYHLSPTLTRPTLAAGCAGGLLCLIWGLRAIGGNPRKALPLLTLIPVDFVLLSQAMLFWMGDATQIAGQQAAGAAVTASLALSFAMTVRIAWAGVVFDAPAKEPVPPTREAKPPANETPTLRAGAARRV